MNKFLVFLKEWQQPIKIRSISTGEEMACKLNIFKDEFISFESYDSPGEYAIVRLCEIQVVTFAGKV